MKFECARYEEQCILYVCVDPNVFLCRILMSTPIAITAYFLIWYVPDLDQGKVVWYLVWYCLFQTLQTVSHLCSGLTTSFFSYRLSAESIPVLKIHSCVFSSSVSMCRTLPLQCSSVLNRKRGTLPPPTVSNDGIQHFLSLGCPQRTKCNT